VLAKSFKPTAKVSLFVVGTYCLEAVGRKTTKSEIIWLLKIYGRVLFFVVNNVRLIIKMVDSKNSARPQMQYLAGRSKSHHQFDKLFLSVLDALIKQTLEVSSSGTSCILKLAETYVSDRAAQALQDFQTLYFGDEEIQKEKQQMNKDVDDLFEQTLLQMKQGKTTEQIKAALIDDSEDSERRLTMSAIQKELESIIRLDEGMKEKMIPILSTMQFDDELHHRLTNISAIIKVVASLPQHSTLKESESISKTILAKMTSNAEKMLYHQTVLHEEIAEQPEIKQLWLDDTLT
jgi:hypothetical protein